MADHTSFLEAILTVFPNQVHLVARFASQDLAFTDATLRVFLPDFHWMSRQCLQRYSGGYQFNGNRLLKDRRPAFHALLQILEGIRGAAEPLEVFQLGDRFDLWREMTHDDLDVFTAYERVRNDPDVAGLNSRLDTLDTQYVRGNHDAWLGDVEKDPAIKPSKGEISAANDNILLAHGHRYDIVEAILPDTLKADLVGLCPKIKPGTHAVGPFSTRTMKKLNGFLDLRRRAKYPPDLFPVVTPDGARILSQPADVDALEEQGFTTSLDVRNFLHGDDYQNDFEHASYLTFGGKIFKFEQNQPTDHRVYVIGHTHHARILADLLPTGKLLVTMDCGGWIENCTVYNDKMKATIVAPSAQVGVQCGNDLRIYQLGGNPGA